jgi:hypothetical protein
MTHHFLVVHPCPQGHVNSVAASKTLKTFHALTFEFNRDRKERENLGLSAVD